MITSDRVEEGLQIVESSNQITTVRERAILLNDSLSALLKKYPKTGSTKMRDLIRNKIFQNEILKEAALYLDKYGK